LAVPNVIARRLYQTFRGPALALGVVLAVGTFGYKLIAGGQATWLDCFYMTFITIATIGFGEVIDLSQSQTGRAFTIVVATFGIGVYSYALSKTTAFLIEGEFNLAMRRRRMLKRIDKLQGHYIVCGIGRIGTNVARELSVTGRELVVIDTSHAHIDVFRERHPEVPWLHGDAAEDELLIAAGIAHAAGVFAVVGDDSKNLVIALSAKQLNPKVRVVARCHDVGFIEKIRRVGADAIVSPDFTGGLRMASAMIRPQVVTFLDEMLRSERGLRVEEIEVAARHAGRRLGELASPGPDHILIAIRTDGRWRFNPAADAVLAGGEVVIAMATPEGRRALEAQFA
jgi:voltage-gated potassium channel